MTTLTLVPCGWLAAFPLAAVPIDDGRTVGETLPVSIAPSARVLLHAQHAELIERSGVYEFGNPRPTHYELPWGEAEAFTLFVWARRLKLYSEIRVQEQVTRASLVRALSKGYIVGVSCHGVFNVDAPLESALLLAKGQRLLLADLLSYKVNLQGLRLLILSACQTAILDMRGAVDEVRSLAVGMLQAGAKAVLAALWIVDDRATYLLIVRFAQEWFPRMESESPAAALARAQQWLRTVTYRDLQTWQEAYGLEVAVKEIRQAGSKSPLLRLGSANVGHDMRKQVARFEAAEAERMVSVMAGVELQDNLDACPYADPIYWAGFQIIGW